MKILEVKLDGKSLGFILTIQTSGEAHAIQITSDRSKAIKAEGADAVKCRKAYPAYSFSIVVQ